MKGNTHRYLFLHPTQYEYVTSALKNLSSKRKWLLFFKWQMLQNAISMYFKCSTIKCSNNGIEATRSRCQRKNNPSEVARVTIRWLSDLSQAKSKLMLLTSFHYKAGYWQIKYFTNVKFVALQKNTFSTWETVGNTPWGNAQLPRCLMVEE